MILAAGIVGVLYVAGRTLIDGFSTPFPVVVLGLIIGMTYGVLGVGLVLIYRSNRIVNFAHGEIGSFAASLLGTWVVVDHVPYWVAFPFAIMMGAAASMLVEVMAVRRLRKAPAVMSIVATLGAATFLLVFSLAVNTRVRRGSEYPQPPGLPKIHIGALIVTQSYAAMLFCTPLVVLALVAFLRWSRFGIAIRAAADNRDAADLAGISSGRMSSLAWGLAGAISAYTAILQFPQQGFVITGQSLGPGLLIRALTTAVVARMTSLPIALGFGVVIGVIEQVSLFNSPSGGEVEVILFLIIVAALLGQSKRRRREDTDGSWLSVQSWEPLPEHIARLRTVRLLPAAGAIGLLALLAIVSTTTSNSSLTFSLVLGYTLVGLSVFVVTGLGGQLSLGQFAVAGIGAAASAHTVANGGGFFAGFLAAGLVGAVVSTLIGIPALRIRGLMLAVTTLAFAVMCDSWLLKQGWVLGDGTTPGKPIIGSLVLDDAKEYLRVAIVVTAAAGWLAWNAARGGVRRNLVAIRDNEDAARALGVHATRWKLSSFALAGFLAGVGGAVYAHSLSRIDAATFASSKSITVVAITAIGGLSLLAGPFLGALYLIALPVYLPLDAAGLAASTLGWLILVLYFPGGIAQLLQPLRRRLVGLVASWSGQSWDDEPDPAAQDAPTDVGLASPRATTAPRRPVVRPDAGNALLSASHVSKHFGGVVAVDDVSLDVFEGETLGIIGANGAGKTTMFEIISGFTAPDSGKLTFDGRDITGLPPERRAELGLVRSFQDARLFPTVTVLDAVRLACERAERTKFLRSLAGWPSARSAERRKDARARELVARFNLEGYRHRRISELSTGTRRITELTCLVALEPKLLLLDEPSSGVAQREIESLGVLLAQLKEQFDATLVVIEHDIPLVMGISNRIVAMEAGSVIAAGDPEAVRADPKVVASYLGGDAVSIERSGAASAPRTAISLEDVPVPGLGPARVAALTKAFGGLEGVRDASIEDLLRVPGVGPSLADKIHAALRERDTDLETAGTRPARSGDRQGQA
ncbi:MAG: hypothetical protein QOE05_309 [Actinomycetota bacterium]|nr:hypothetical protein [Actinomycetota bacterium]